MRNRRLESFLDTNSTSKVIKQTQQKIFVKKEVKRSSKSDVYVDDDGWISALVSCVRLVTCFLSMMVTTFIWALIMLVLIPWPNQRIKQGNIYGHVTCRMLMWILGNSVKIEGREFSNERAIYISNHASPIDIFLIMWLTPTGTVGIAKKEIIWYPLFGQLYVLANHLRIDRSNPAAAIQSMKEAAASVVRNKLSLIIFPEGTRSKNGRLLPFKKLDIHKDVLKSNQAIFIHLSEEFPLQGFVHLALQTRLPIVPMVLTGTHQAWRKGSLHVRPAPIEVKYLPPIRTDDWTADKIDDYLKMLHDIYAENVPDTQKPLC